MTRQGPRLAALMTAALLATPAAASPSQPVSISIDNIDLGSVTAAASGDTVFRIDPASGAVQRISGAGSRAAAGSTRAVVRITCAEAAELRCNTQPLTIQIAPAGAPGGRARPLTNFTVAMGSASLVSAPGGGANISFIISPVGEGQTRTFYVGADLPIIGDSGGGASGESTSGFLVSGSGIPDTVGAQSLGQARARVIRALSMTRTANLSFGSVVKPLSGDGLVVLDAATGVRTVTGGQALGGAPSSAAFTVSGEAGETVSIGVPGSLTLSGPGGIVVTLATTLAPSPSLQGAPGAAGNYSFKVGGSFPISAATPTGVYNGSFVVTADYN